MTTVLSEGDPSPSGGTFKPSFSTRLHWTASGQILLQPIVQGGTNGIFILDSVGGSIQTLVLNGDPMPTLGGTIAPSLGIWGVAGNSVVFRVSVTGGAVSQALLRMRDVTSPSDPLEIVAYAGQPTGLDIGGSFSSSSPFSTAWPQIRTDGAVVFTARLTDAQIGGVPTERGIFLWNGDFTRVVVEEQELPTEQVISGVNQSITNNTGDIVYLAVLED